MPAGACTAYWDRNAGAFFLASGAGGWRRTAVRGGAAVGNGKCTLTPGESRVQVEGDQVTVEFALQFAESFAGSKLVYAYADGFGGARNTGWVEAGSWRVTDEGPRPRLSLMTAAAASTVDPNDLPKAELYRPDTPEQAFLRANPGATALAHQQGRMRFRKADGKQVAALGGVTHRDAGNGDWAANAPVLSETKNGWRVDGTENGLLIKKQGINQHVITQIYSDYGTKHDSVLTLTVPSLVYDAKSVSV